MTIEELIDDIQMEVTVGGAIPRLVPDVEVRRIIQRRGIPYFWKNYRYSVTRDYYLIKRDDLLKNVDWNKREVCVPENIIAVNNMWEVDNARVFSIGLNAPNLSLNIAVTNQPYLTSFVTTLGELGVYKVALDGFADAINKLSKWVYNFEFTYESHVFKLMGKLPLGDLVLEVEVGLEECKLFEDEIFIRWCVAKTKVQMGRIMGMYTMNLPGNVQINNEVMLSQGVEELAKIEELIQNMATPNWFISPKG